MPERRGEDAIAREIAERREDLARNVSRLEDVVRDKLDVKARLRRGLRRGYEGSRSAVRATGTLARDAPAPFLIGAGGLLAAGMGWWLARQRARIC